MDKQTAIDLLDNLLGMVEDNHESDYDTAIKMGIDALKSNAPNALSALDCVDRQAALEAIDTWDKFGCDPDGKLVKYDDDKHYIPYVDYEDMVHAIKHLPSVQPQRWIPVSEALPEDLEAVNIIWVNHEPEPYYHDIKDKNFVATGIHYRNKWYWYSTTCADFLGEYGSNEVEEVDDAVEIIAWMPLPEPWRGGQDE